jgi:hypothetical protein
VKKTCCDLGNACAKDANCSQIFACIAGCPSAPHCPTHCLQSELRNDVTVALHDCIRTACDQACNYGHDWECLGNASWGPPPTKTAVSYQVRVSEFLTQKRIPNATVAACENLGGCGESAVTDENGIAQLTIPTNPGVMWQGFFRVSAAGYENVLAASNKPVSIDDYFIVYLVSSGTLSGLAQQFGVALDDTKALIFATALDCNGFNAPGIEFELTSSDPGILSTYFAPPGGNPDVTSTFGTAAFANVPVTGAPIGISMYLDGEIVGDIVAPLEAGTLTLAGMFPEI